MGLGKHFISYMHCLLEKSRDIVALNGSLTKPILLRRSIRHQYSLALLLFFIVANALGWLVADALSQGSMKGLRLEGLFKDLCP